MMLESEISQYIVMAAAKLNCILHRNNSGAFKDETGRTVRFGLGNISKEFWKNWRSSDYIGITTIVITPEMVGKKIGVFTAIEMKKEAWKSDKKLDEHERAQKNMIDWTIAHGGIAGFANSVDDLPTLLNV